MRAQHIRWGLTFHPPCTPLSSVSVSVLPSVPDFRTCSYLTCFYYFNLLITNDWLSAVTYDDGTVTAGEGEGEAWSRAPQVFFLFSFFLLIAILIIIHTMAYHTTTTTTIISTRQNTICHQCPISFKTTTNGLETLMNRGALCAPKDAFPLIFAFTKL